MKKKVLSLILALTIVLCLPWQVIQVSAYQPDKAFIYDSDDIETNKAVPSTNAYRVELIASEQVMGCTRMNAPTSLFVDDAGRIFVLDSGNCRVLVLDETFRCIKELSEFTYKGEVLTLAKGAQDIFFRESNQKLYIAD